MLCAYLVEKQAVIDPNQKEKGRGNKAKQTVRMNQKAECESYLTGSDSSSEVAEEFHSLMDIQDDCEKALIPEENP